MEIKTIKGEEGVGFLAVFKNDIVIDTFFMFYGETRLLDYTFYEDKFNLILYDGMMVDYREFDFINSKAKSRFFKIIADHRWAKYHTKYYDYFSLNNFDQINFLPPDGKNKVISIAQLIEEKRNSIRDFLDQKKDNEKGKE